MAEPYRQYVPDAALSLERNTDNVPNDGKYYLLRDHRILASFSSLKRGQARFRQVLKEIGYQPKPRAEQRLDPGKMAVERYLDAKEEYWGSSYKFRSGGRLMNR